MSLDNNENLSRQQRRRLERERAKLTARQPHIQSALAAATDSQVVPRGRLTIQTVRHDDWCPMLHGTGPCRCEPEITFETLPPPEEPETPGPR